MLRTNIFSGQRVFSPLMVEQEDAERHFVPTAHRHSGDTMIQQPPRYSR